MVPGQLPNKARTPTSKQPTSHEANSECLQTSGASRECLQTSVQTSSKAQCRPPLKSRDKAPRLPEHGAVRSPNTRPNSGIQNTQYAPGPGDASLLASEKRWAHEKLAVGGRLYFVSASTLTLYAAGPATCACPAHATRAWSAGTETRPACVCVCVCVCVSAHVRMRA